MSLFKVKWNELRLINQHKMKNVFQRETYDDFFFPEFVTSPPMCRTKYCELEPLVVEGCPAQSPELVKVLKVEVSILY